MYINCDTYIIHSGAPWGHKVGGGHLHTVFISINALGGMHFSKGGGDYNLLKQSTLAFSGNGR